jgi:hypothetical protein
VYHLELRQFPHVARRFNQSEQQVRALAKPWVGEEWIDEAERKWNMNEASLTILEGPKLSMADLAMGRGWRNAQRRSDDVTERVLGEFRKDDGGGVGRSAGAPGDGATTAVNGAAGAPELALLADSLGLELLALLDDGPVAPGRVWQLALDRLDAPALADALALADASVRSLLARRLVMLYARDGDGAGRGEASSPEQVEAALGARDAWAGGERSPVLIARKG